MNARTSTTDVRCLPVAGAARPPLATPPTMPGPARRATRIAFTLVEMLVAIAVVAILTIGIGQIFGSVSKLVGTGAAVAEVDQAARTVEAQLREDFDALSAMPADKTFIAIRNTRLGDFNLDATFTQNKDTDLYLTKADEQADLRDGYTPYEVGPNGRTRSRAVTVRLDEIEFIGQSGRGYQSYEGGDATGLTNYALISYGQPLRPPLETEEAASARGEPPRRLNYADGYFGAPVGAPNRFAPRGQKATGRNRYAADFVLARQALLLYGPNAIGYPKLASGVAASPPPLGYTTEIAIYPRDLETSKRFFGSPSDADDLSRFPLGAWPPAYPPTVMGGYPYWAVSKPTVIRHGRTDICAMDRDGVQRWLEGGYSTTSTEGRPFTSGIIYEFQQNNPSAAVNVPLWYRTVRPPATDPVKQAYLDNLRGLQSAIAGTFCRPLIETNPPDLRIDPQEYKDPKPDPRDRRMDVHAILAEHCSSFEVAWSNGARWDGGPNGNQELDVDTNKDGTYDRQLLPGDVIWFDMDFTYRDFWEALTGNDASKETRYPRPNPDPEMGLDSGDDRVFDKLPSPNQNETIPARTLDNGAALNIISNQDFPNTPALLGAYSRIYTQARDRDHRDQEYMAIWGFNPPVGYDRDLSAPVSAATADKGAIAGNYVRDVPWAKPTLIRVRMTLHDSQNRLRGGKTYEFIFKVNLK